MYLSRVRVRGLRGSVDHPLEVSLPGRFAVIAGANGGGKTTFSDAVYLGHPQRFPHLPRHSAAALGPGDRDIEVAYRFEADAAKEGPAWPPATVTERPFGAGYSRGGLGANLAPEYGEHNDQSPVSVRERG